MSRAITTPILVIEDDEDDYLIIRNLLHKISSPRFSVERASNSGEARTAIAKDKHDVYLVDYRLGATSGLDLLADLDLSTKQQPFIILTGAGDSRIEEQAMTLGVADYLVKGSFDVELLARVLRYSIQRKNSEMQRIVHLKEINKSKDEFIALASHQLRTPATAVKQYIGMLMEGYAGRISPKQRTFLDSAYTSNELQLKIVNDILKIAQLDLKKISLIIKPLNVHRLLSDIIKELKPIFASRKQTVDFEVPDKTLSARADKLYLSMAVTNVIDNASKYSDEGKTIHVSASSRSSGTVRIVIRDEGIGMTRADQNKLFIKFSRIPNRLSVKVGGTGLGLYWSKEIIRLHSGVINVVSVVDKGTTFTIDLPATE